jgi:2-polyprenyl-3-methyl-5-hydroxy-6-metoxy-1,4-benzoquinol methylase
MAVPGGSGQNRVEPFRRLLRKAKTALRVLREEGPRRLIDICLARLRGSFGSVLESPATRRKQRARMANSEQIAASNLELMAPIQAEIVAALGEGRNAYYRDQYKDAEIHYWPFIPSWLTGVSKGAELLDVGCAYGTLALFAQRRLDARVRCIDTTQTYQPLELFARASIDFRLLDIEQQPIPEGWAFDVIIFTEVLEHLNFHPVPTLRKLAAALKPRGALMLSTPNAEVGWGRIYTYYRSIDAMPEPRAGLPWIDGHVWQYTEVELRRVLRAAGLAIERLETTVTPKGLGHFNVLARSAAHAA